MPSAIMMIMDINCALYLPIVLNSFLNSMSSPLYLFYRRRIDIIFHGFYFAVSNSDDNVRHLRDVLIVRNDHYRFTVVFRHIKK